jgi:hypothetical protein
MAEESTGLWVRPSGLFEALKDFREKAAPHWHNIAQKNLDRANALLAERRGTGFTHP